jgi:dodecin
MAAVELMDEPALRPNSESQRQEHLMSDHVYKIVELVGSSKDSIEDAIQTAIKRADATVRNLRWFEVIQTRGHVEAGFTLEGGNK